VCGISWDASPPEPFALRTDTIKERTAMHYVVEDVAGIRHLADHLESPLTVCTASTATMDVLGELGVVAIIEEAYCNYCFAAMRYLETAAT